MSGCEDEIAGDEKGGVVFWLFIFLVCFMIFGEHEHADAVVGILYWKFGVVSAIEVVDGWFLLFFE